MPHFPTSAVVQYPQPYRRRDVALKLLLALSIGLSTATATAQPTGSTAPALEAGGVVPLSGSWRFMAKGDDGLAQNFHAPDFDDSSWSEIRVPGAYNYQGYPGLQGVSWYRRTVTVPAQWEGRPLFVQLPPIDDQDETYWNGQKIGGLGSKQFTKPRLYKVPADQVKWGQANVLAVMVTNKYMDGGFGYEGAANLISPGPFVVVTKDGVTASLGDDLLPLAATDNVAAKIGRRWEFGWRDAGTADTRPKMHARQGPDAGSEALGFEVTHPNASGEFLDYNLLPQETGKWWAANDYDFIQFDYQTEDTEGEMQIFFNSGGWRWKKGNCGLGTSFPIKKGGWTRVVIPFEEFKRSEPKSITYMGSPGFVKAITLGYRNNELRAKGEVKFANFAVGRFATKSTEKVKLEGLWHFARDPEDQGTAQGWHQPGGDFKTWETLATGFIWPFQGQKDVKGVAWLKQEVYIPANWKGTQLRLRLGRLSAGQDRAEVFFNGAKVGETTQMDPKLDFNVAAGLLQPGGMNTIALKIQVKTLQPGLMGGPFEILPQSVWVAMKARGSQSAPVISTEFDPVPIVGRETYQLSLRVPAHNLPDAPVTLRYTIKDCFHRVIKSGEERLQPAAGENYLQTAVDLNDAQSRQLYFSEYFDVHTLVVNEAGQPVYAGTQLHAAMSYAQRDEHALEPLPETWEDTPYGKLKLVDAIDAAQDPAEAGVVYKEGGHRESWVGRRAYSTWEDGVTIEEFQGRKYREVNNNEWFGYRVGRGKIQPGKAYLVRMEYPEDKTRYVPINIDTSRNYQGLGFKTGVGEGDAFEDYPISGQYKFFDTVVIPDQTTYGSRGSRTVSTEHGFWIFFFDNGRVYSPQFQAGPAVARILVYELPEGEAALPAIRYPEGPRRYFVADWEREPEWVADDMVRHAQISGYNAISPSFLKWGSLAFWHVENTEKLPLKPVKPIRDPLPADERSALELYLEASKTAGMTIFPRLEYGGTDALPKTARAIGLNGKGARPNRFHSWCSNLLEPEVFAEFSVILDQVVGSRIQDNPQIGGILFRNRSDRMPISYGQRDVELFAQETGADLPEGLEDVTAAKWASAPERHQQYMDWWHGKRRDFHGKILEKLRGYRPDLALMYYNWDPDAWNPGRHSRSEEDYRDAYSRHTSIDYYRRMEAHQEAIAPEEYVSMIRDRDSAHLQVRPELYAEMDGFAMLGPVNWKYTADNPAYINYFRTGEQLALTKLYNYEEKGRWNVQGDNYETSEMSTGGHDFAMAEYVLAFYHGDPWIFTETTYTYGVGFLDRHRQFAQAFLSLPATKGELATLQDVPGSENLRLRTYTTPGGGKYISATYKGYKPGEFSLKLQGDWPEKVKLTDLVTGSEIPATVSGGLLQFNLQTPAMTLHSFRVE